MKPLPLAVLTGTARCMPTPMSLVLSMSTSMITASTKTWRRGRSSFSMSRCTTAKSEALAMITSELERLVGGDLHLAAEELGGAAPPARGAETPGGEAMAAAGAGGAGRSASRSGASRWPGSAACWTGPRRWRSSGR